MSSFTRKPKSFNRPVASQRQFWARSGPLASIPSSVANLSNSSSRLAGEPAGPQHKIKKKKKRKNTTLSSFVAPALGSNPFSLSSGLRTKPESKVRTKTASIFYVRQNPFGFRRPKNGALEDENQAEGSTKPNRFFIDFGKIPDAKSLIPVVSTPPSTSLFVSWRRKDPRTVFVAGATGQAGIRIAQSLLRQGFAVRAGVSDLPTAQELARLAATYGIITPEESKRLNAVESIFEEADSIAKAIGPATKVVVTIGPAEKGPSAKVTTNDALQVVRAAQLAGVGHVAVVYDSASGISARSTYNVLDGITSLFSNLFAQSQPLTLVEFLSKLVQTDVSYTLIKARLTEDYAAESSYGLVVSKEGSTTEKSKVARSQIATLVADVFSNTSIAENKVVEVSTSSSATSKSMVDLFSAIPEDGRRKAYAEALAKAKAEEEAIITSEKAREAAEAAKKLEEEVKKLSKQETRTASLAEDAPVRAEEAGSSLDNLLSRAKGFGAEFSWEKMSSQITSAVSQKPDGKPRAQIATVRSQAKAQILPPQKAAIKRPAEKPKQPKPKRSVGPDEKPEVRNVFGGLFKQETFYVDDE